MIWITQVYSGGCNNCTFRTIEFSVPWKYNTDLINHSSKLAGSKLLKLRKCEWGIFFNENLKIEKDVLNYCIHSFYAFQKQDIRPKYVGMFLIRVDEIWRSDYYNFQFFKTRVSTFSLVHILLFSSVMQRFFKIYTAWKCSCIRSHKQNNGRSNMVKIIQWYE